LLFELRGQPLQIRDLSALFFRNLRMNSLRQLNALIAKTYPMNQQYSIQ